VTTSSSMATSLCPGVPITSISKVCRPAAFQETL
jgi:hypothetical protein